MARISLGYYPREWQRECHRDLRRFSVLALHRRAGKTELAIIELITRALSFTDDMGLFLYMAPLLKQAKLIAWSRLKERLKPLRAQGAITVSESELAITFKHNKAVIRVLGADNPDAARGLRVDGCVMDEVAQMRPEVWVDIIQPALSDRKGWSLFIGTPAGVNLFSELYFKAQNEDGWMSRRYTVFDTDSLDQAEVNRLQRDMAPSSFSREYLCDFSAAGDDQLLSLSDVQGASQRELAAAQYTWSPKIFGVDPARFGGDRSVIFLRQGLRAGEPIVMQGIDNMALADRVAAEARAEDVDQIFVDSGAGAGVIDRLRQLGVDCVEVPFGGRPIDPQYKNKRAEMWCMMADWIQTGSIPDIPALKQDLSAPTYSYDVNGRKMLESKDSIKARGLPSPDLGDALALTFAMPVPARTEKELWVERHSRDTGVEYDPLDRVLW